MFSDNNSKEQYQCKYWLSHVLKKTQCVEDSSKECTKHMLFLNNFQFPVTIKKMHAKAKFPTVSASNQIFGNLAKSRGAFLLEKIFQV